MGGRTHSIHERQDPLSTWEARSTQDMGGRTTQYMGGRTHSIRGSQDPLRIWEALFIATEMFR